MHAPRRPQAPEPHLRIVRWQRRALYLSGWLLLLTGGGWLGVHYVLGAGAGELPHPLEAWCIRLHGAGVFAGLFVLGAVAATHVPQGWRLSQRRRWAWQRLTGLLLCAAAALLMLSGYLLYYFAPEPLRPALGWLHAGVGGLMALAVAVHRRGATRAALKA